jgi:hypothetical protein
MAIDETRHHDIAPGVDGWTAVSHAMRLEFIERAGELDNPCGEIDSESAMLDQPNLLHFRTATRPLAASQSQQLAARLDEEVDHAGIIAVV